MSVFQLVPDAVLDGSGRSGGRRVSPCQLPAAEGAGFEGAIVLAFPSGMGGIDVPAIVGSSTTPDGAGDADVNCAVSRSVLPAKAPGARVSSKRPAVVPGGAGTTVTWRAPHTGHVSMARVEECSPSVPSHRWPWGQLRKLGMIGFLLAE